MARATTVDAYVTGLNELLRDLKALPKEYQDKLRDASVDIATRYMVPSWQSAALNGAGRYGPAIAGSVKAKRDRIPSVSIGSARRAFSGGASPTMVRYPSDSGVTNPKTPGPGVVFGDGSKWISQARGYAPLAMQEWGHAVERVCADFNRGGI
jgi:hypothetical protein